MTSVLRDWIASGAVIPADDRWQVGERFHELDADIPDTVRTLIDHQLRRLDEVERTVLEGAALVADMPSASVVAAGPRGVGAGAPPWRP